MKLSFSLPSKSSSKPKPNPIKPSPNFNDDKDGKAEGGVDSREYVTEFDGSKTLTDTSKPKNVSIAPIQNEWRPHKKMKNLELPITQPGDSGGLHFEVESASASAADGIDSKISYGLNLRQNTKGDAIEGSDQISNSTSNGGEEREFVAVEDFLLQKLKEDLKRLPEDRGMEEFEDMPVEGFGAALLAGYGWREGMGIGKNAKEDAKIVEYTKRAGKHGIGFSTAEDVPTKRNTELNSKGVEKERVKDVDRVSEGDRNRDRDRDKDRERESGFFVGKDVRIVGGRNAGLKGRILEKLGYDRLVLKLSRSGESVKVSVNDIAELGSKEEERCLKRLKELKIQEEAERKESKRTREEGRRESRDSQRDNQRNVRQASWLTSHIRVRIISKDLKGGRLYLKKGEVVDVVGPKMCDISMDESRELVQGVSQDLIETALPRRGGPVLVLSGKHKGVYGNLVERDLDREIGVVRDADTHSLLNVQLEHIAEYIGDPSLLGCLAAGWPSWLVAVAGEAIRGWVPRRADSFEKLDKIGQGTYSNVYRARDLDQKKIVALKKVRFDNLEPESVRFMAREIHILRRLDHPNVIKLEGLVTSWMSCSLYLVFEYMEHDLAGLASHPGLKFTEAQVKCYMQQLLCGLDHCHSHGVLHRDIKGSNLLIDNNGILKIADFGLASFFDPHQHQPLTSRVVTLWYRPPELLLGATYYGTAVDLWSTGCILAELYAGKPIMPGRTEVEQLHKIFKLCGSPSEDYWRKSKLPHATIFKPQQPYRRCVAETFKDFPAPALALMEILLSIDPADRGSSASALKTEFFTTKPLPCDPSSLPKYPPSKEFDAKVRDEEARRQGAAGSKGQRGTRESRAVPAPDANAELVLSMQKRQGQSNSKSRSEKFNPHPEEVASGFPIDPPRPSQAVDVGIDSQGFNHKRASHSGPLAHRAWAKATKNPEDAPKVSAGADLSTMSGLVAARRSLLSEEHRERSSSSQSEVPKVIGRFPGSFKEATDSSQQDQKLHMHVMGTNQKEDGRLGNKDPILIGYGSKNHKIHYSGPLLVPSSNMDQMLKDHDRHVQEAVRRARHDKAKVRKVQAEGNQISTNSLFVSGR